MRPRSAATLFPITDEIFAMSYVKASVNEFIALPAVTRTLSRTWTPELCLQVTNVSDIQMVSPELVNPILAFCVKEAADPKFVPSSSSWVPMFLIYVIAFALAIEKTLRTSKDSSDVDVLSAKPAVTPIF